MSLNKQLAKHLREVHFGGNWTWSNFKENLADVTWQQATTQVHSCNSIALLVFHMNYYLNLVTKTVRGEKAEHKHEYSFQSPEIKSQQDWEMLLEKTWTDTENFARLIEEMPEEKLWENISEKQGSYYRNIQGVIEHNHYHLGQIALLKKIILEQEKESG